MNTFRPPEATPEFNQSGTSVGVQDRFALSPRMVLESTFAGRWFEVNANTTARIRWSTRPRLAAGKLLQRSGADGHEPAMGRDAVAPVDRWHGQHLFKVGLDFQDSSYDGTVRAVRSKSVVSTDRWPSSSSPAGGDAGCSAAELAPLRRIAGASGPGLKEQTQRPLRGCVTPHLTVVLVPPVGAGERDRTVPEILAFQVVEERGALVGCPARWLGQPDLRSPELGPVGRSSPTPYAGRVLVSECLRVS